MSDSPETEIQSPGGSPKTILQDVTQRAGPRAEPVFPPDLLGGYRPEEIRGRGTEGVVWRATDLSGGGEVAVKVHWTGQPIDQKLLRHLGAPEFRRHIPEIMDFGEQIMPDGVHGWAVMEYLPETLDDLLAREGAGGRGLPEARVRELLAELCATLRFWQGTVEHYPIDFKPDNIAVRPGSGQFVVCDFGGVVRDTATQRYGVITAARGYTSPEGLLNVRHPASPWWSLGEIVYRMLTGRLHFEVDEDAYVINTTVMFRGEMDLSAVTDERWKHLLMGLFTKEPADRWTAAEVEEWLAGGLPDVIRPDSGHRRPGVADEPIYFRGDPYLNPADLARALLARSREGADWIAENAAVLRTWLRDDVVDGSVNTLLEKARKDQGPELVLAFGAAFARDAVPTYLDHPIDSDGLVRLCADQTNDLSLLQSIVTGLELLVAARYRCGHRECCPHALDDPACSCRCAPLVRVANEVPDILSGAGRRLDTETRAWLPRGRHALTEQERRRLHTTAITLVLGAETGRGIVGWRRWYGARLLGARGLPGPRPWAQMQAEAIRADESTFESKIGLAVVSAVENRVELAAGTQAAREHGGVSRLRGNGALLLSRLLISFSTLLMLLTAVWAGSVCGEAYRRDIDILPGDLSGNRAAMLGGLAADRAVLLLPLAVMVAAIVAGLPKKLGPVVLGTGVAGFLLGWLPRPLSGVPIDPWSWPEPVLEPFSGIYGNWTGVFACVLLPVVALGAAAVAMERVKADGPGYAAVGLPGHVRGPAVHLFRIFALPAVLWSASVVGQTLRGDAMGSAAGAEAGRTVVEFLPVLLLLSGLIYWRGRKGKGGTAIPLTAVVTGVAGLWPGLFSFIPPLNSPEMGENMAGIGGAWGEATVWWALLVLLCLHAFVLMIKNER